MNPAINNFFITIQALFSFFAGSTRRWRLLNCHVKNKTLKGLSGTRWSARIDAVSPLRSQTTEVCDALMEVYESQNELDLIPDSRGSAFELLEKICDFHFLVLLVIWHELLVLINHLSKMTQSVNLNIDAFLSGIVNLKSHIAKIRNSRAFEAFAVEAFGIKQTITNDHQTIQPEDLPFRHIGRPRRVCNDDSCSIEAMSPKESFQENVYFKLLDCLTESLTERFEQMMKVGAQFRVISYLLNNSTASADDLKTACLDVQFQLTHNDEQDIDGSQLFDEIKAIKILMTDKLEDIRSSMLLLKLIYQHGLELNYPNLTTLLRIYLTLPVSVASAERSFSKLKLIKNYRRTTMSDERLNALASMAIEKETLEQVDVEDIFSRFCAIKKRSFD